MPFLTLTLGAPPKAEGARRMMFFIRGACHNYGIAMPAGGGRGKFQVRSVSIRNVQICFPYPIAVAAIDRRL
jgi:hypothetical protein